MSALTNMPVMHINAHCHCQKVQIKLTSKPLLRFICHCQICQSYNQAEYADVCLFLATDVQLNDKAQIDYQAHQFPPILQRGTCRFCHSACIEKLNLFPLPKCIIVPVQNIQDPSTLPAPLMHVFYAFRVHNSHDQLPKYKNYLHSQLKLSYLLLRALWQKQTTTK